jgi:hypothetical protein
LRILIDVHFARVRVCVCWDTDQDGLMGLIAGAKLDTDAKRQSAVRTKLKRYFELAEELKGQIQQSLDEAGC